MMTGNGFMQKQRFHSGRDIKLTGIKDRNIKHTGPASARISGYIFCACTGSSKSFCLADLKLHFWCVAKKFFKIWINGCLDFSESIQNFLWRFIRCEAWIRFYVVKECRKVALESGLRFYHFHFIMNSFYF